MEIYVQSRGRSPDFEYCWLPENPPYLDKVSGLIQSESPSIVITRSNGQLMLLVTAMQSSDKKDFRNRPVRNSVAWVCDDTDEKQLRAIAVQALRGTLGSKIDEVVRFGGQHGFNFSQADIEQALSRENKIESHQCLDSTPKVGKNSQTLRDNLADNLERYSLPDEYEILVIVTGNKAKDTLVDARAWRALSNLINSEDWESVPDKRGGQKNFQVAVVIVAAVIVIALIVLVLLLHPFNQKPTTPPTPVPTASPNNPPTGKTSEETQSSLSNSQETLQEPLKEQTSSSVKSESEVP